MNHTADTVEISLYPMIGLAHEINMQFDSLLDTYFVPGQGSRGGQGDIGYLTKLAFINNEYASTCLPGAYPHSRIDGFE